MAGVWILAETYEHTLELLNAGGDLASKLKTKLVVFLWGNREMADEYIHHGADEVLLLPSLPEDQPMEVFIPVIAEEARRHDPDIFLVGATARGKEMAARIATRLNTGLCSECIGFKLDEGENRLVMERMVYGGAAVQTVICLTRPQMATIPPRTFEPASKQAGKEGTIVELPVPAPSAVRIVERKPKVRQSGDVAEARVLVCIGRGIEQESDLSLARELAEALGGEVACTRPLAEELHWLPEETYIGLSGKKVKPDLYIGVGISGQIQHTTGIRDAKVICAINRDENAPIFGIADYGIVGDLYEVLPELTRQLGKVFK